MNMDKTRIDLHKNPFLSGAINKRLIELKSQITHDMFRNYEFEQRGNKIFIMTKQAKAFTKIRPIRKGLLFAELIGDKLTISEFGKRLFGNTLS